MKPKLRIPILGLAMTLASQLRADYTPIILNPASYNGDIVVEKAAAPSIGCATTVSMDNGTNNTGATWYEIGYNTSATTTGVPAHGATFTSTDGNHQFLMAPSYTTNDVFFLSSQFTNATVTLSSPTPYTALSFLTSAGGGPTTVNYVIHFADTTTQTGSFVSLDWFNNTPIAYTVNGRVDASNGTFDSLSSGNPRLYYVNVALANASSAVTSVDLAFVVGARASILAIAGSSDGTTYTAVPVTGYNADSIVEATGPHTGTLTTATSISMEGGTANTGRAWYEKGYYPAFPGTGLPPAGSTITSLALPDHSYQLAPSYAANNVVFVDSNHPTANVTFSVPANYNALSFLSASVGGPVTNQAILQFADGSTETNVFMSRSWATNTPYAYVANGRVNLSTKLFDNIYNVSQPQPRLSESQFTIANGGKAITNVIVNYLSAATPTTNRAVIFAVAGTTGPVAPIFGVQPSPISVYEGSNIVFATTIVGGTAPITFQWQVGTNGVYVNLTDGGNISGSTTTNLTITGATLANSADYRLVASNAAGPVNSGVATLHVFSTLQDVTSPSDSISLVNGSTPFNELVSYSIDNSLATKYLNYGNDNDTLIPFVGPVGLVVTPNLGSTLVTGLRIYTANDTPLRDPADYTLEGSNDGGNSWEPISTGPLALPDGRNTAGTPDPLTAFVQEVDFPNANAYLAYRLTFMHVKSDFDVNSTQIGEIELLGSLYAPPAIVTDLQPVTMVYAGRPAVLSVTVSGTTPMTYQWQSNGVDLVDGGPISGAHTSTLTIANPQPNDVAIYQLWASNVLGGPVYSTATTLEIQTRPTFNGSGSGWGLNGGAVVNGDVLDITAGLGSTARSAFYDYPLYIGAFKATFTYVDLGGGGADGMTFTLQNSPAGAAALGATGGGLGYQGITPSAALEFNVYQTSGMAFRTNGATGTPYNSTSPVDVGSGDNIDVTVLYLGGVVQLALTNQAQGTYFTTNINVGSLPAILGGDTAYVGFTGGDGLVHSYQQISNFSFVSYPTLTSQVTATNTLVLTWPTTVGGFELQSTTDLLNPNWQSVAAPITVVAGKNQAVVPITSDTFYRLNLP